MLFLDWGFAIVNTAIAVVGAGFLAGAYQVTQRVQGAGPRVILSGPLWIVGFALLFVSVAAEWWHFFGPIMKWVFSFFKFKLTPYPLTHARNPSPSRAPRGMGAAEFCEESPLETLDRGDANADEITYTALVQALREGKVALVDVREPNEYEAGHVEGAILHPLSSFDPAQLPRSVPIVLMCRSGNRSMTALNRARAAGFNDIWHYKGGAIGWTREGGELV